MNYENTVIIKNLPCETFDESEVAAGMIGVGICLDMQTKCVERLESFNRKSGILRAELFSTDDKMSIFRRKKEDNDRHMSIMTYILRAL